MNKILQGDCLELMKERQIKNLECTLNHWYIVHQGTKEFEELSTQRIHVNQHYYKELTGHNYPIPMELLSEYKEQLLVTK